jgi:hypothetical protein
MNVHRRVLGEPRISTYRHFLSKFPSEYVLSVFRWPKITHVNVEVVIPEFTLQKPVQGRTRHPISHEVLPEPTHSDSVFW